MLCKRIIPCLDVADGRTVKGVQFQNLRDIGDPVELALIYQDQGADELLFLDISASHEGRETMFHVVEAVARRLMIPFTVGGGVTTLAQAKRLLASGADKVSINTGALRNPSLIRDIAEECGSQCCVLAIDARRKQPAIAGAAAPRPPVPPPPVWEALTHGGRSVGHPDAFVWAREAVNLGAGEILLTSWDQDGTLAGFDLALTRQFAENLPIPVIASGGGGGPASFVDVFCAGGADAALAASIFHDNQWTVDSLKREIVRLNPEAIAIRL
ncbi:MAG: imidazole glycerol phosphate synthase subunit HisF [Vampirovibrionales bacterium]|nr:imidazole glycerol phosphate synthase subunit HisF [Vampirovibrionales bacterium]